VIFVRQILPSPALQTGLWVRVEADKYLRGDCVVTFEEFAATRLTPILAFAAVLTGQRAAAEDITQEVLIRAYAKWDTIGSLDKPEFDVRKMVLNEFLSTRRRSWRLVPSADLTNVARSDPDHAQHYADRSALLAGIGRLPRQQRAVIVLRFYEDRSDQEIAELLGCKPGSVRATAARALRALRVDLHQSANLAPAKEGHI
jgi:RNA polymerase sigma-70 factor (sigma-E family)